MRESEWQEIFAARDMRRVREVELVLTAMDIAHDTQPNGAGWSVVVAAEDAANAQDQLAQYWFENQPNPIKPVDALVIDSGWPGVWGYLAVIWCVSFWQANSSTPLSVIGRVDVARVMDGEWWRVITALTLHADIAHIISNSVFGAIFGLWVGRYLGSGLGWLFVLLCGATGNLIKHSKQVLF